MTLLDPSSLTIQVLQSIRDEVKQTNLRLDRTNLRLDQSNPRLGRLHH